MIHHLPPGSKVRVEQGVLIHESQRIIIKEGISEGKYIVLEDLGIRVTLLPKEGGIHPVTTYKL